MRARELELSFYQERLSAIGHRTVLDIGANNGSKTEIFRSLRARVVAVEADPDLGAHLLRRFAGDRSIIVERVAVAAEAGTLEFFKFEGNEAFNTASPEWAKHLQDPSNRFETAKPAPITLRVPAVTLASLVERHGPIHYLKVDVEGLEWSVLSTLTTPIPLISLEFNLPVFQAELTRCVEHLARLDPRYRFNAAITEPPLRLELERWLRGDEFLKAVAERGWLYAEVYGRIEP